MLPSQRKVLFINLTLGQMKQKLLLVLLSLFCLSAIANNPKKQLVVWAKDGTKVKYDLAEDLKIAFTLTDMVVVNNGVKSSFLLDDMLRFTYENMLGDGDVNGDGKVDFVDIITTISHILGENPGNFLPEAADMNGDGKISIIDITMMIDNFPNQ